MSAMLISNPGAKIDTGRGFPALWLAMTSRVADPNCDMRLLTRLVGEVGDPSELESKRGGSSVGKDVGGGVCGDMSQNCTVRRRGPASSLLRRACMDCMAGSGSVGRSTAEMERGRYGIGLWCRTLSGSGALMLSSSFERPRLLPREGPKTART